MTGVVTVNEPATRVVVTSNEHVVVATEVETQVVEVGVMGPQGPAGAPGATGSSFHFEQPTVALVWLVTHGLGYFPALARCEDSAGTWHHPTIVHIDQNTLELHFVGPTDGVADFS